MDKHDQKGWAAWDCRERAAACVAMASIPVLILMLSTGYGWVISLSVFLMFPALAGMLLGIELDAGVRELVLGTILIFAFICFYVACSNALDRFKMAEDTFSTVTQQRADTLGGAGKSREKLEAEDAAFNACSTSGLDLNNAAFKAAVEASQPFPFASVFSVLTHPQGSDRCLQARQNLLEIDPRYPFKLK